jgi:DNA-binding CsgD family transcriptional regulator
VLTENPGQQTPTRPRLAPPAPGDWEAINFLTGRIYDCVLDPGSWDDTLYQIITHFCPIGWQGAFLIWEGHAPPRGEFIAAPGITAGVREMYAATYAGRNPWSDRLRTLPDGTVFDTRELISLDTFKESQLSRAFLEPWGIDRCVGVLLDSRKDERLSLTLPGPGDRDVDCLKRALTILAPHLQRATRISHRVASLQITSSAAALAAEASPYGVLTLDGQLNILTANSRTQDYLASGAIAVTGRRLSFPHKPSQQRLLQLLQSPPPTGDAFRVPALGDDGVPVLAAHISPQAAELIRQDLTGAALILTIGCAPEEPPHIEVSNLVAWFDLTPTEARLASDLARGRSLSDYAGRRAISLNAARFTLKSVFRKTGAKSQAQLVAILSRLPQ